MIPLATLIVRSLPTHSWFGSEAYNGPPGGLNVHDVDWCEGQLAQYNHAGLTLLHRSRRYMDFLKRHEFNAIRLLFTHE